jgi:hypothetical protein
MAIVGRLHSWFVCGLVGWSVRLLVGWLASWLIGWFSVGRLVGWLFI